MKGLKYIFILTALFAFASCQEESAPYEPGNPINKEGNNVYFSEENPSSYTLTLADNQFTVVIERENDDKAISVPLTYFSETSGIFDGPKTVDFGAGETSKEISVLFQNADPFEKYNIQISIPEEFTNQYKDQPAYPIFKASVIQEDYAPFKTGYYFDYFWYEDGWDQVLEYSAMLDKYRLRDVWEVGADFTFSWDGDQTFAFDASKIPTGINHSSYGLISAGPSADNCAYAADAATVERYDNAVFGGTVCGASHAIYFAFTWTVSAGSFGDYYNAFYFD